MEALLIKKALARFNGNVSHAADALGLSRSALYRRLQAIRAVGFRRHGRPHAVSSDARPDPDLSTCHKPAHLATKAAWCCWRSWPACPGRQPRCDLCCGPAGTPPRYERTLTTIIVLALAGLRLGRAGTCGLPAADALQPAGRAARGRLFGARPFAPPDDALGEVMREVNTLGSTLREQRLGAMEATTLLRTVMREIDVAIFAFDEHQRLRLVNRAAERLLAAQSERCWARRPQDIGPRSLPRRSGAEHLAGLLPGRRRPLRRAPHANSRARPPA